MSGCRSDGANDEVGVSAGSPQSGDVPEGEARGHEADPVRHPYPEFVTSQIETLVAQAQERGSADHLALCAAVLGYASEIAHETNSGLVATRQLAYQTCRFEVPLVDLEARIADQSMAESATDSVEFCYLANHRLGDLTVHYADHERVASARNQIQTLCN